MSNLIDLTGQTFGKLTVLEQVPLSQERRERGDTGALWLCHCSGCGRDVVIPSKAIRKRHVQCCPKCSYRNNGRVPDLLRIGSEEHTIQEWSDRSGVLACTIYQRLRRGWKPEDAVFTDTRRTGYTKPRVQYRVLDKETLSLIAEGTADECAVKMGVSVRGFYRKIREQEEPWFILRLGDGQRESRKSGVPGKS